jgi:hypothetical protein
MMAARSLFSAVFRAKRRLLIRDALYNYDGILIPMTALDQGRLHALDREGRAEYAAT